MRAERNDAVRQMSVPLYLLAKIYFFFRSRNRRQVFTYDFPKDRFRDAQVIVLSDHASFESYVNVARGLPLPRSTHPVIANLHFLRPVEGRFLTWGHAIPIRPYVSDLAGLMKMVRAVKAGHSLLLFPEGMYSFCGVTHPIMPATVGFLREMGVDVILAVANGEFLTTPRFHRDRKRGTVEVRFSHLFTGEELLSRPVEELEDKLCAALRYNDFLWNEEKRYSYRGRFPNCTGIENVLYLCPRCGSEGALFTRGNDICCKACGNTVTMDEAYRITPKAAGDCLPYRRVDEWYLAQRRRVRAQVKREADFSLRFAAALHILAERGRRGFRRVGEGTLTIDRSGTTYRGSRNGEETELFIPIRRSFGASNQDNRYLVFYDGGDTLGFTITDGTPIVKAEAAIEELHALTDPAWERALCRAYYPEETRREGEQ